MYIIHPAITFWLTNHIWYSINKGAQITGTAKKGGIPGPVFPV
jgi:hypothetical protein